MRLKQGAMDRRHRLLRRPGGDGQTLARAGGAAAARHRSERRLRRQAARTRRRSGRSRPRSATSCRSSSAAASAISTPSRSYLDDGVSYVIIGTAAVKTPGFLHDACTAFPGHVMVAPGRQGRQSRGGRLVEDDRPRSARSREEVPGLRRGGDHLHRHRARRHADRRQHRCHRDARARARSR